MKNNIKKTYICRSIKEFRVISDLPAGYIPQAGDVGIFEIVSLGKHKTVQGDEKRNVTIIPGDMIMAAFGTRYATAQFEGYLPKDLNEELVILGAGGTIGTLASMHDRFAKTGPTSLKMIGLVANHKGEIINTKSLGKPGMLRFSGAAAAATKVILSLGSSMDSGKTTSAAYLVRGLKEAGYRVAFIKLTGTVYTKDCDLAKDLGAVVTSDFSDLGYPSTYMCGEHELLDLFESLLAQVLPFGPDYVVMEIADGLYERETKMLLTNPHFMSTIHKVIFSAGDSLSAVSGVRILNGWGIYPALLCGLFTTSPLLIKEVRENCTVPVCTLDELRNAAIVSGFSFHTALSTAN